MFTVCPKCALTLVVTAADLRIAQGYVRCGRCLNVFNALTRLSEERPSAAPEPETKPPGSPGQTTAPPEPSPSSIDDTGDFEVELDASVLVTATRAAAAPPAPPPLPDGGPGLRPAATNESVPADSDGTAGEPPASPLGQEPAPQAQPEAAAPAEAAASPDPAAASTASDSPAAEPAAPDSDPATEAPATPDSAAAAPEPAPAAGLAPALAADPAATAEPAVAADASSTAESPDAQHTELPQQQPESAFELEARRPRAGLAWQLGAGALAIVLALQIVNHYRDALAADPALREPLSRVYSVLGVTLAPHWNLHAYEVRQLGASVAGTAAGEIVVRASVTNSASRAQPLPLLRVTLQDRFGNRIAARDVPPGDYLPSPIASGSLLAAGSRVDATMVFVDPGPRAVGFEIDACLRQHRGQVACAHGP